MRASDEPADAAAVPLFAAPSVRGGDKARPWSALVVLVGLLGSAFWLFHAVWAAPGRLAYGEQDATLFDWFMAWTPHALGAGGSPLFTHAIGAPDGVNLMWNTPVVLPALLTAPVTWWAGPLVSYNLWITLAPALSGFAAYLAFRRWVRVLPAAVGGLLYGFSPVLIGASAGHIHVELAVFPPLALALLDDVLVRQRHPRRSGALLGLAAGAQLLISSEVLLTTAFIAVIGMLVLLCLAHRHVRPAAPKAARGLGYAAAAALPLAAGPLVVQFFGGRRPMGPLQQPGVAVSDLLTPLVPTPLQQLAPASLRQVSHHFTGSPAEVGGYLGLPLLVVLIAVAVWRRREPLVRWIGLTGLVTTLFTFGPRLHIAGHVTPIRMPWALLGRLPLLDSALPSRLALYVALLAAMLLAIGLNGLPRRLTPTGLLVTTMALLPLVPALPHPPRSIEVPAFFTSPAVREIPSNGLVLALPVPALGQPQAMAWQAAAGIKFRLVGCYCIVPGSDGTRSFNPPPGPLVQLLQGITDGQISPPDAVSPRVSTDLAHLAPAAVLVGPTAHRVQLIRVLTQLLGPPTRRDTEITLWLTTSRREPH